MKTPHDSSDVANLIWADWHEEFGDQEYADDIRLSVNALNIDQWQYEYEYSFDGVVVESIAIGGNVGGISSAFVGGVDSVGGGHGIGGVVGGASRGRIVGGVVGTGRGVVGM